jgi:hypothetical protein
MTRQEQIALAKALKELDEIRFKSKTLEYPRETKLKREYGSGYDDTVVCPNCGSYVPRDTNNYDGCCPDCLYLIDEE